MFRRIKGKITELYGTQRAFAEHLGVPEQCVSQRLSGKTGFSKEDIEQWAEALELPVVDFFYKEGSS